MAPLRFDRTRIESFVALALQRLHGEWILIGGGAAAAWFSPHRTTEDIDMIGLGETGTERIALMELAVEAGLPIEAVNSAADFFLRRIPGWRDELVVLAESAQATVYRPSATLFLLLKLGRLSATDLEDCVALLAHKAPTDPVDRPRVRAALAGLAVVDDVSLANRRLALASSLDGA